MKNMLLNGSSAYVRGASAADSASLQGVYLKTRVERFHWLDASQLRESDFDRDTAGEKIWLAELDGRVIGFVSVWLPDNFIHHLFVLPEFSGQKVGSALLAVCLGAIGRPAQLKCLSANLEALQFYLAKGWKTISKGFSADGEYHLMQKD